MAFLYGEFISGKLDYYNMIEYIYTYSPIIKFPKKDFISSDVLPTKHIHLLTETLF